MKYRFYPSADRRQDEIWDYTFEVWDEEQADQYIRQLHKDIQAAADKQVPWRVLSHKYLGEVYFIRSGHHHVFFRVLPGSILGILTILHESMDIPSRLREDERDNA